MVNALFTALALIAAGQAGPTADEGASTQSIRGEHAASLPARRSSAARAKGLARLRSQDGRRQG